MIYRGAPLLKVPSTANQIVRNFTRKENPKYNLAKFDENGAIGVLEVDDGEEDDDSEDQEDADLAHSAEQDKKKCQQYDAVQCNAIRRKQFENCHFSRGFNNF